MSGKKKNKKPDDPTLFSDDPRPLNFDHALETGASDRLNDPFMTPEEERGDNEDSQSLEEEEAQSPEETRLRKKERDL